MDAVWEHIAQQRREEADFLEALDPDAWNSRSLCAEWTVREVAAHLAWQPSQRPTEAMSAFVRSGFRVNRVNVENARRWASLHEPAEIVERLRSTADDHRHLPSVKPVDELVELLVHDLDMRRPLGRPRQMTHEAFRLAADRLCTLPRRLGVVFSDQPRRRAAGLRLVSTDVDWSHGSGGEVHGLAESLLLALAGRPVGMEEFAGSGSAELLRRTGAGTGR